MRTRRAAALQSVDNSTGLRRSTRAQKPTKLYQDEDESSWAEDSSEEEVVVPTRRSKRITSRTTKSNDYQLDSDESLETEDGGQVGEDEEYEIEEYEDCEVEELNQQEHKFTNIIASKTQTLSEWHEMTSTMNTVAISNGSRWAHNTPETNLTKTEERFLVKWTDLSYLHCSWETKRNLVLFCPAAKQKLSMFHKKSVDGLLYSADERGDGDFFNPSWTAIERILNCSLDEENTQEDEDGTIKNIGRQFYIKWVGKNYSE
eukprot:scaffold18244_cov70-Cyclotella_meneghiniana.AAC.1